MRCALHFATKLNSRDIQKCHCFWVPSNDLFASARRSSISRANGDQRSQIEKHVAVSVKSDLPQKSSTVLSEPKSGPPAIIPGSAPAMEERFEFPFSLIGKSTITFLKGQSWRLL